MTVALTPYDQPLLSQLADAGSPQQLVERGLERLAKDRPIRRNARITAAEAVDRILQLGERNMLGGIPVKELVNEGRKY